MVKQLETLNSQLEEKKSMENDSPRTLPTIWPALTTLQRRVLGVLVEKAKTTPEAYPLSLNGLTVGSNQKSNRDPVMNVNDEQVGGALDQLQERGLVTKITGSRVDRWRHNLYEQWQVDKAELAILAELMLRGAQTEGELRGHASRMEPIADLEALRQKLKPLAERKLVLFLGAEGKRGTQIASGFHSIEELDRYRTAIRNEETASPSVAASPAPVAAPPGFHEELTKVKEQVTALQSVVERLQQEMAALKTSLGG